MKPHSRARLLAMGLTILAGVASAELEVIYDSGVTRPLAPLLAVFGEPPAPVLPYPPDLGVADIGRLVPIRSPGLTPGPVAPRPLILPPGASLSRPMFLIGSDPRSLQWLVDHLERLRSMNAVGMLVQADTVRDFEVVAELADGLPVLPAPADDIARALGIHHIPVLISRHGIEQ